jgi:hypothetical protein
LIFRACSQVECLALATISDRVLAGGEPDAEAVADSVLLTLFLRARYLLCTLNYGAVEVDLLLLLDLEDAKTLVLNDEKVLRIFSFLQELHLVEVWVPLQLIHLCFCQHCHVEDSLVVDVTEQCDSEVLWVLAGRLELINHVGEHVLLTLVNERIEAQRHFLVCGLLKLAVLGNQ